MAYGTASVFISLYLFYVSGTIDLPYAFFHLQPHPVTTLLSLSSSTSSLSFSPLLTPRLRWLSFYESLDSCSVLETCQPHQSRQRTSLWPLSLLIGCLFLLIHFSSLLLLSSAFFGLFYGFSLFEMDALLLYIWPSFLNTFRTTDFPFLLLSLKSTNLICNIFFMILSLPPLPWLFYIVHIISMGSRGSGKSIVCMHVRTLMGAGGANTETFGVREKLVNILILTEWSSKVRY